MTHQDIQVNITELKKVILAEDHSKMVHLLNWFLDNQLCEKLIPVYQEIAKHSVKIADELENILWQQAFLKEDKLTHKSLKCFGLGFIGDVSFPINIKVSDIPSLGNGVRIMPKWYSGQTILDAMPSRYRAILNGQKQDIGNLKISDVQDSVCLGKDAPTLLSRCLIGVGPQELDLNLTIITEKLKDNKVFKKVKLMAIGNPIDVAVECEVQMDLYRVNVWLESLMPDSLHILQSNGDLYLKAYRDEKLVSQTRVNEVGLTPDMLHTYLSGHVKNIYIETSSTT